ncbi:hypothetical protein BDY21DRAFT_401325, partial [Lineolata rhizophorae]
RCRLAPLDLADRATAKGFLALWEHFSFPSGFVSERIQSVSNSFGARTDSTGVRSSWFHFLCKDVNVASVPQPNGPDKLVIVNPNVRLEEKEHPERKQSQADHGWIRSGFFLKSEPRQKASKSNKSSPVRHASDDTVTLVCFGASPNLEARFKQMTASSSWEDVLHDPYVLFDIIMDELYLQMDGVAWRLNQVFGQFEGRILNRASFPGEAADDVDFVGLHNLAKHIIHMREASDAVLVTLDNMRGHHKHDGGGDPPSVLAQATQNALRYRRTLFTSTQLRLGSMEKRMQNIINLSYNLVTQQDSKIMQRDSGVMKSIAVLTLIFLPASTIATMFGSQFFSLEVLESGKTRFIVSKYFWIFFAVALPVTLIVLLPWSYYYRKRTMAIVNQKFKPKRTSTWNTDYGNAKSV